MKYYITKGGRNYGPFDYLGLAHYVRKGALELSDLVCPEGGTEWVTLADLPEPKADIEQHRSNIERSRDLLSAVQGDIKRPKTTPKRPKSEQVKLSKTTAKRLDDLAENLDCTRAQAVNYLLDLRDKLSSLI